MQNLNAKYFDEAIEASNNRKFEVLSRMAPNEIFGQNGAPINENAEHTVGDNATENPEPTDETQAVSDEHATKLSFHAKMAKNRHFWT